MDIFIPYGTVSSVVFTIFGENFSQAIVLGVGPDNSYIAVPRSAASAGSLPFLAIDRRFQARNNSHALVFATLA
jgi:hypothetical protein